MSSSERITSYNDPPPSYDSLFKELSNKKTENGGIVNYTQEVSKVYKTKLCGTLGFALCGLCCSLVGFALPVAEVVIGSLYLKDCPSERLLPIYLIVGGVFAIISGGCCGGQRAKERNSEDEAETTPKETLGTCCSSLLMTFLFVWLICGSVWVFKMQECDDNMLNGNTTSVRGCFTTNTLFADENFYCKEVLYKFVYYETIVKWVLIALVPVFSLIACCFACCAYMSASKSAPNDDSEDP
ncbi:hypothetical protein EB796_020444 [Bugula neritina]|uniref:Uncharacterized protein n=1 Tax=Bugula neritina TaxID=10212 RepID=A0A7J7J6T9_BUGNE|nr:hypothetical protein EB796_020444 [Bugula neritina]